MKAVLYFVIAMASLVSLRATGESSMKTSVWKNPSTGEAVIFTIGPNFPTQKEVRECTYGFVKGAVSDEAFVPAEVGTMQIKGFPALFVRVVSRAQENHRERIIILTFSEECSFHIIAQGPKAPSLETIEAHSPITGSPRAEAKPYIEEVAEGAKKLFADVLKPTTANP
jgi:hypothetical protein